MSCKNPNCINQTIPNGKYCELHKSFTKICNVLNCTRGAQGNTDKCINHGGGKRCCEPDCKKSAIAKTDKCKAHGGGKRFSRNHKIVLLKCV